MNNDPYTHKFEFSVGPAGGTGFARKLKGKIEFNSDEAASYKITDSSDPFLQENLRQFMKFIDLAKEIFDLNGEIGLLKIEKL